MASPFFVLRTEPKTQKKHLSIWTSAPWDDQKVSWDHRGEKDTSLATIAVGRSGGPTPLKDVFVCMCEMVGGIWLHGFFHYF